MFGSRRWKNNQGIRSRGLFSFGDMNRFGQDFLLFFEVLFLETMLRTKFLSDSTSKRLYYTLYVVNPKLGWKPKQDLDSDAPVVMTFIVLMTTVTMRVAPSHTNTCLPFIPRIRTPLGVPWSTFASCLPLKGHMQTSWETLIIMDQFAPWENQCLLWLRQAVLLRG